MLNASLSKLFQVCECPWQNPDPAPARPLTLHGALTGAGLLFSAQKVLQDKIHVLWAAATSEKAEEHSKFKPSSVHIYSL